MKMVAVDEQVTMKAEAAGGMVDDHDHVVDDHDHDHVVDDHGYLMVVEMHKCSYVLHLLR